MCDEGGLFIGLKLRLGRDHPSDDLATVEAVRKAVGEEIHLIVDFNKASISQKRSIDAT